MYEISGSQVLAFEKSRLVMSTWKLQEQYAVSNQFQKGKQVQMNPCHQDECLKKGDSNMNPFKVDCNVLQGHCIKERLFHIILPIRTLLISRYEHFTYVRKLKITSSRERKESKQNLFNWKHDILLLFNTRFLPRKKHYFNERK